MKRPPLPVDHPIVIGVLPGEGIGPEVVACALDVLARVAEATDLRVEIRENGPIGCGAEGIRGASLPAEVVRSCSEVFERGGAILKGPLGGRNAYDLRKHFDLFMKISPIQMVNGLADVSRLRPQALHTTDVLIARENTGGAYQGRWKEKPLSNGDRIAEHALSYSEEQVRRFLLAAARLARSRAARLAVAWKEAGLPSVSSLWRDCAIEAAKASGVRVTMVDANLLAYRLVQEAPSFDVIAAPNLIGDILTDLAAVLLGSRGSSFSGNFGAGGEGVYESNHGSAHDLAGKDRANPAGQIFSLAMMLRESFNLGGHAEAIEDAVRYVWRDGWRTADVAAPSARIVGTREMGSRIAERASLIARRMLRPSRERNRVA
jgi:3-isopropylmalate dehydrogenase